MRRRSRIFWFSVIGLVLLLVGSGVAMIVAGGTPALRARMLSPAPGSVASISSRIKVTFPRPMLRESILGKVTIEPPVPFELDWSDNELEILPGSLLQPDTQYTVTIGPGLQDRSGTEMTGSIRWAFRTRLPRVAYIVPAPGEAVGALWICESDGSGLRRLSTEGQSVTGFTASRDGSALVYAVAENPTTANLWRVDLSDPDPVQITSSHDLYLQAPNYSPSGDILSVEMRRPLPEAPEILGPPRLELRRPTDGTLAGVVYDGEDADVHSARWSPDGTKIAFIDGANRAIGVFNFTTDYRFYPVSNLELSPHPWSPDGGALVYVTIQAGSAGAVLVTQDIRSGAETVVQPGIFGDASPAWSPAGRQIAYSDAAVPGRGRAIWLTSLDGTGTKLLTAEPSITNSRPIWSPDGGWLLFSRVDPVSGSDVTPAVWMIRPDGTEEHEVAPVGVNPAWVP